MNDHEKHALLSDASDVANHALIMALITRVSANNLEVFKEIMRTAIAHDEAGNVDTSTAKTAAVAKGILESLAEAHIKANTPKSALGPGGFQSRVL